MAARLSKSKTPGAAREYTTGEWAGQTQLRCKLCQFDTLKGQLVMLQHLIEAHESERALAELIKLEEKSPVKAVSPNPKPIEEVEDATNELE